MSKSKSKSRSREEERQQEEDPIAPAEFKFVPFDYRNYLSTHKSPVIPVIDYKQPIREAEKRDYDEIEQNRWDDAPLYPVISKKSPSEKSPSKKRPRYSAKGRKGRKGGTRKSSKSISRNTKKTTRK